MRSTRAGILFACLLLAGGRPAAGQAPSGAEWQARQGEALRRSESILQRADAQEGLLAQYQLMRDAYTASRDPVFRRVFGQYLSWYQTFIGDYPAAAASFSIRQSLLPQDNPSPLAAPGYSARSASRRSPNWPETVGPCSSTRRTTCRSRAA